VTAASIADLVDAAEILAAAAARGAPLADPLADLERLVASRVTPAGPPVSGPRRTYTRTRTFYFSDDAVAPLLAALDELDADWARRRPHIEADIGAAGAVRLTVARYVIGLLAEPVAE
jgi:hypothetical protein